MMVNIELNNNNWYSNWCWLLLPNYDELVEQYYKLKDDIILMSSDVDYKLVKGRRDIIHFDLFVINIMNILRKQMKIMILLL